MASTECSVRKYCPEPCFPGYVDPLTYAKTQDASYAEITETTNKKIQIITENIEDRASMFSR